MKKKFFHSLGPLFGIFLFAVAIWVLHHELREYHYHDVLLHMAEIPAHRLLLALAFTILSYLIMTGYDVLALRYIRHPISYGKIALASFIGYAFSNNTGLSMIVGASVRYRLYSAWGLSALETTKVIIFCSLTIWLGFFTVGGMVFLFEPMVIPEALHLPFASVHYLGIIFIMLVAAYLLWSVLRKKPLTIRKWKFPLPSARLFLIQITIASLDWALAGSVLYALLPATATLSFPGFLGIFLLAQFAGIVSQIPGGVGVFESVVLLLLSPTLPASLIFGSLLAYRAIYYFLPLGVATVLLGSNELLQKRQGIRRIARIFYQSISGLAPYLLSFTIFAGGAILLFSGATPAVTWRLKWLTNLLPLPIIEISHFLGSLVGMELLIVAWGLWRRLDAAYLLTVFLLCAGIIFSLLKGFDYEEAIALAVMLGVLLPSRRYFYRKASIFSERLTFGWFAAIVIVLIGSGWLGIFVYKHVEYSNDLWWHFTFYGNAPRFLRAMVGVIGVALFFTMARLLHPASPNPSIPEQADLEKVSRIVRGSSQTYANLALLGDKAFLFNQKGNAFIMYGTEGKSWIAMGDPVGPKGEWTELVWRFRELSDHYDAWPVFYEVGHKNVHLYLDLGLTLLKLGEEARVSLYTFSLEGRARKGLRYTQRKLEKEGFIFEVIPIERVSSLLPELKGISDDWLAEKNSREKGFSLGFFEAKYLKQFPVGIVHKDEKIVAFANIWQGAGKEELSIDLMRYLPEAPHGVMEYLFIELMLWGRQEKYRWFNLGMAPLSGIQDHTLAPLWNRLGAFVFRHGEHFYNLKGLRRYKEKFEPEWEPKYLAATGGLALPHILTNVTSLISGGIKGIIAR